MPVQFLNGAGTWYGPKNGKSIKWTNEIESATVTELVIDSPSYNCHVNVRRFSPSQVGALVKKWSVEIAIRVDAHLVA